MLSGVPRPAAAWVQALEPVAARLLDTEVAEAAEFATLVGRPAPAGSDG